MVAQVQGVRRRKSHVPHWFQLYPGTNYVRPGQKERDFPVISRKTLSPERYKSRTAIGRGSGAPAQIQARVGNDILLTRQLMEN